MICAFVQEKISFSLVVAHLIHICLMNKKNRNEKQWKPTNEETETKTQNGLFCIFCDNKMYKYRNSRSSVQINFPYEEKNKNK